MAHSFDIRFGRSGGIAALFDAAGNSFGWKGGGRLQIDAQGMNFALKRGLVSLLAPRRSQRIPAERINEVYREGDALRIEFATDENPRATLPFWARDRDTAAQIVRLLPTSRTVELEQTTAPPQRRSVSRIPLALGALAMLIGVASFLVLRPAPRVESPADSSPTANDMAIETPQPSATVTGTAAAIPASPGGEPITPDEARKLAMLAEDPVDWTKPPPRSTPSGTASVERAARLPRTTAAPPAAEATLPAADPDDESFVPMEVPEMRLRPDQFVVRIPQTTLAYGSARELLDAFAAQAAELNEEYRSERQRFDRGALDPQTYANRLDALEMRWRTLRERTLENRKYSDPALTGMRGTLLTVVISERVFLAGYAEGVRLGDQARIDRAFAELAKADEAMERARLYLQ